ncbi:MAG: hypothetical protein P1V81_04235 [Planctomycetota bacterium]|nr:hypothetical protein [Planctomycetota bacterium]
MTPSPDPSEQLDFTPDEQAFLDALQGQLEVEDQDLRDFPRLELELEVRLSTVDGPGILGHTLDIARGGLRGRFETAPALGGYYGVRILGLESMPTLAFGRCLRVELTEDGDYCAMLHFGRPIRSGTRLG